MPTVTKQTANRESSSRSAGRGLPRRPKISSPTNQSYQAHIDTLAGMAKDGDWKGVKAYQVNGVNTYARIVARYRDELLASHKTAR